MKKNILLLLFAVTITITGFAQVSYTTSCEIKNGTAYGYVHNLREHFEIDGTVWFYFYDTTGRFISSEDEYEYEYVSSRSTEEIEYTTAPGGTCSCIFDIKEAIKTPQAAAPAPTPVPATPKTPTYTTSCEIKNGTAYGYVNNLRESFEIDGKVWFYFYDAQGNVLDSEDEYEYEYVSSQSTEEIEYTTAPARACSCQFDVAGAIKK